MIKREHSSLYFADDKDIYDLILSARKKLTEERLLDFLRDRGIYYSLADSKEDIAVRISRMTWSWSELRRLIELTDPSDRRERLSSQQVTINCSIDDISSAISSIVEQRQSEHEERYNITTRQSSIDISVSYTDMDWSRTRLQQRVRKELRIEIDKTPTGASVRFNASDRGKEISAALIKELEGIHKLSVRNISLEGIQDAARRTEFFVTLMKSIDKHELVNVSAVRVHRLPPLEEDDASLDATQESDDPSTSDDEDEEEDVAAFAKEDSEMLGVVSSIALHGTGVHHSQEYKRLIASGFYIYKAIWRSRDLKGDRHAVELEAEFSEPKACADFRYSVRGVYSRRQRGGGNDELRTSAKPPTADERTRYVNLLELAAGDALDHVTKHATGVGE